MTLLTRRDFLRGMGVSMAGLALPPVMPVPPTEDLAYDRPPTPLGRIATWRGQAVRLDRSTSAELVAWRTMDEVIPLLASALGEAPWPTNPIWYKTSGGWIHSGYVQPVRRSWNREIISHVASPGFWSEVCLPLAEARREPQSPYVLRKLYYGTIYRVIDSVRDEGGKWWYQIQEGFGFRPGPYVEASSLQRIPAADLAPISRGRPDKRIVVSIARQDIRCYEGQTPVFSTRIGSGLPDTATPRGEFRVWLKRHTSRMVGGGPEDPYDLPGVAFPVYFTYSGVATHGTYWHNDFGRRHSHGCVNVTNEAARWINRWADPVLPYVDHEIRSREGEGTRVVVV
jgi:hypothetical protein